MSADKTKIKRFLSLNILSLSQMILSLSQPFTWH